MSNEGFPHQTQNVSSQSSCLRKLGITCLVMAIVGILVTIFLVAMAARNPTFRQVYTEAKAVAECQLNLQNPRSGQDISDALERYVRRNDKYPESLDELYPDFLENKEVLYCPSGPKDEGSNYTYAPPALDDADDAIIIECRRHIVIEGQPPMVLLLQKDGTLKKENFTERIQTESEEE